MLTATSADRYQPCRILKPCALALITSDRAKWRAADCEVADLLVRPNVAPWREVRRPRGAVVSFEASYLVMPTKVCNQAYSKSAHSPVARLPAPQPRANDIASLTQEPQEKSNFFVDRLRGCALFQPHGLIRGHCLPRDINRHEFAEVSFDVSDRVLSEGDRLVP
jgi:hypothetical protein